MPQIINIIISLKVQRDLVCVASIGSLVTYHHHLRWYAQRYLSFLIFPFFSFPLPPSLLFLSFFLVYKHDRLSLNPQDPCERWIFCACILVRKMLGAYWSLA